MPSHVVRPATRDDAPDWLAMIAELARFEKLAPPTPAARRRLVRDAFGPTPRIEVLIGRADGEPAAYAILAWTYSSFLAKPTLWLEDIYLRPAHRGTGLSRMMLVRIAARARKEGAGRIEGAVLDWNKRAQQFYVRTGAKVLPDWRLLRYDEATIRRWSRLAGR